MQRPLPSLAEVRKALSEKSLRHFIQNGWRYIDPSTFVSNWHIDAICDHLEAVARGELRHLIINVPPRHMKSLSVSVAFPAWVWAQQQVEGMALLGPQVRFLATSYAQSLSVRDNLKCRRLIESPWYRENWGDRFSLTSDQNTKIRFENDHQGYRIATSVDGTATGEGGDIVMVDDALSAKDADSETQRAAVIEWWDGTMSTRLNDPKTGSYIVIMQRLHELDLVGHILERAGDDWTILCLPARYEPDHPHVWPDDPRSEPGELLWPARMGEPQVRALETALGSYGAAGQLQQRPAPREGGMFKRAWFKTVPAVAVDRSIVRSWDFAATEAGPGKKPDWTAGVKVSRNADGLFVIEHCRRFQATPGEVERTVHSTAMTDRNTVTITIPEDPGQAGVAQAKAYLRLLAGWVVKKKRPTGDKVTRANPAAAQAEAGNIAILVTGDPDRDAWIEPFLDELTTFPNGAHDDQVDAFADAFNELAPGADFDAWLRYLENQAKADDAPAQADGTLTDG